MISFRIKISIRRDAREENAVIMKKLALRISVTTSLASMIFPRWLIIFRKRRGAKEFSTSVTRRAPRSSGWWHQKSPSTTQGSYWWLVWHRRLSAATYADRWKNSPSWRISVWYVNVVVLFEEISKLNLISIYSTNLI